MTIEAPAKINLTLEVTGIEESGYHTLDTIFAWLDLHDTVTVEKAGRSSLTVEWKDTKFKPAQGLGPEEENLAWRALTALERFVDRSLPSAISLTKRIPVGGGLGGGSADAAAVLWSLNKVHNLGLARASLTSIAANLGADVAFGLLGGVARGRRYGDLLEPVPFPRFLADARVVLAFPPFGCATPEVYAEWDRTPDRRAAGASERFLRAETRQELLNSIGNDLQGPAFRLFPELSEVNERMIKAGLTSVCLSGSGSTFFGFLPKEGAAHQLDKWISPVATWMITGFRREARSE